MQEVLFFPPNRLRLSSKKIADLLEDFDYTRLPKTSTFRFFGAQRKSMRIELSSLNYRSLADHANYYEKSFTTTIMQILVLEGAWKN
jgi:hypothetical protein